MRQTAKQQLIEDRLGQPLADFVAERYRPYIPGHGWRYVATEITAATGVPVSYETVRAWFATTAPVAA